MDELLTVAEAAARLDVGESTLREWIDRGAIPIWQPGGEGGKVFIVWGALLQHAQAQSACRKGRPAPEEEGAPVIEILR